MKQNRKTKTKYKSPNLFYNTAFIDDLCELRLSFQKEIKQYEHKPTNSQEKNSITILLLNTNKFILKIKHSRII